MADDRLIERYLQELDERLRPLGGRRRRRILKEARDHIVDASEHAGGEVALTRFGDAPTVASAHVAVAADAAARHSVLVFGLSGVVYVAIDLLTSPVTFGLFPPGPWPGDVLPAYLAWKVDLAGLLVVVAALIGLAALVLAWRARRHEGAYRHRLAGLVSAGSLVFLAGSPLQSIFLFQRSEAVAGSPTEWVVALVSAGYIACAAVPVAAALHALVLARSAPRTA